MQFILRYFIKFVQKFRVLAKFWFLLKVGLRFHFPQWVCDVARLQVFLQSLERNLCHQLSKHIQHLMQVRKKTLPELCLCFDKIVDSSTLFVSCPLYAMDASPKPSSASSCYRHYQYPLKTFPPTSSLCDCDCFDVPIPLHIN